MGDGFRGLWPLGAGFLRESELGSVGILTGNEVTRCEHAARHTTSGGAVTWGAGPSAMAGAAARVLSKEHKTQL